MKPTITRTLNFSVVSYVTTEIKEDGLPDIVHHEPVTVAGKVNEKGALKQIQEMTDKTVTITKVETFRKRFEIELDTFIEHAKQVEIKEDEK